jgi:hypothetical protein
MVIQEKYGTPNTSLQEKVNELHIDSEQYRVIITKRPMLLSIIDRKGNGTSQPFPARDKSDFATRRERAVLWRRNAEWTFTHCDPSRYSYDSCPARPLKLMNSKIEVSH